MINQLRIYQINPENREPFLNRFRDHAARIMATYGFRIQAMWESQQEDRRYFVYLLAWTDEAEMDSAWARFMDDQEWKDIKLRTAEEHGDFVFGIESHTLAPTEFSNAIGGHE